MRPGEERKLTACCQGHRSDSPPVPSPILAAGFLLGFRVHAQAIGQAIDVVEIGHDLSGILDLLVGPTRFTKGLDIVGAHLPRLEGHFFCPIAKGRFLCREGRGFSFSEFEAICQFLLFDLNTEVLGVFLRSVAAEICAADDDGQGLAHARAEARIGAHDRGVKGEVRPCLAGIEGGQRDDLIDPSGAGHGIVIDLLEEAGGTSRFNSWKEGHGEITGSFRREARWGGKIFRRS